MEIVWSPQSGPQKALIDCPYKIVFFGGARGGGKTDGVLGKYGIKEARYKKHFNGIFFRKEMPQADDLIDRAQDIYGPLGATYSKYHRQFEMPNGGRLRFRPLENKKDSEKYQGQNLTDVGVEEAGNYETSDPIDRLMGAMRSAQGIPTQMILTGNPGGVGQSWIRDRFVSPAPYGMVPLIKKLPNGKEFKEIYIPSKVTNNQVMLSRDPEYIDRLYMVGSPELVRAWLEGDWDAIPGVYYPEWRRDKHVIERPFELHDHLLRFMSFDWGSASPACAHWWAVSDGSQGYPSGALICYREWYIAEKPGVGSKMTNVDMARGIKARELPGENVVYREVDPSMFAEKGGPSIGEEFRNCGLMCRPADNDRVNGWSQLRQRLAGQDGRPMIYFFANCTHAIRTIPVLQHDERRIEDVDTKGDDHAADSVRYGVMSRPYEVKGVVPVEMIHMKTMTLDQLWQRHSEMQNRTNRL